MTDTAQAWGTVQRQEGRVRICLERAIDHDISAVWEMLTASSCLTNWLAPGHIEQYPGGAVEIDFGLSGAPIKSTVSAIRVPELLEYSWSAGNQPLRPIRWQLSRTGTGTLLQLTLDLPDDDKVALSCAGWDAHLEMLLAALEGIAIHFPHERFRGARAAFRQLTDEALA